MNLLSHYGKLIYYTFYRHKGDNYTRMREYLAEVFLEEIEEFVSLEGKRVLDVGGANGEFCRILEMKREGCLAINLDPYPEWDKPIWKRTLLGSAVDMPFPENSFDVVLCRGVIEHVPMPVKAQFMEGMRQVLKPGGVCYVMTQPWWNPNAGHNMKPFHVLPFPVAKFLRTLIFRNKIKGKSYVEETLFPNTFNDMLRLIRESGLTYVKGLDTHLKLHFMSRIPGVREVLIPSVSFISRK